MSASSIVTPIETSSMAEDPVGEQSLTLDNSGNPAEKSEVSIDSQENVSAHSLDDVVAGIIEEKMPDGFDPSVHAVGLDGKPRMRGDGSFALKRGRKPGGQSSPRVAAKPSPSVEQKSGPIFAGAEQEQISNAEAAKQFCNLAIGTMVALVGPEWAPESNDEAKALSTSVKNYFDAKGQIQLSPEWGLAVAVIAYSVPRFRHENTVSKFQTLKDKIRFVAMKIRDRFGRK